MLPVCRDFFRFLWPKEGIHSTMMTFEKRDVAKQNIASLLQLQPSLLDNVPCFCLSDLLALALLHCCSLSQRYTYDRIPWWMVSYHERHAVSKRGC
jgi:hypothetical protein